MPQQSLQGVNETAQDSDPISTLATHLGFISHEEATLDNCTAINDNNALLEDFKTAPLVSSRVIAAAERAGSNALSQYALVGLCAEKYGVVNGERNGNIGSEGSESEFRNSGYNSGSGEYVASSDDDSDTGEAGTGPPSHNLMYTNVNAPWSTFICGSQGSGKSHTMSCLLENMLVQPLPIGRVPAPLTALVLHYDRFTGVETGQLCEAAYLCSSGVPVRVLVSPTNYRHMKELYENLPGLPAGGQRPKVFPMYLREDQINIGTMKTLMAAGGGDGHTPLYMEVVIKVLRSMAQENDGKFSLRKFQFKLQEEKLVKGQAEPLNLRLGLLKSFLDIAQTKNPEKDPWTFDKGTLTIVDLSCPFVDESDACMLFNICLEIFLKNRDKAGRIIGLDEAHKFLTPKVREAATLTETMLSIIRQQRHLATRVIIATQEPTLSPSLLDLCNMTIVHRFSSPAWFFALKKHLAGAVVGVAESECSKHSTDHMFARIVTLRTGEALLFCPGAILDTKAFKRGLKMVALGPQYARVQIRKRVSADGGRSILELEKGS